MSKKQLKRQDRLDQSPIRTQQPEQGSNLRPKEDKSKAESLNSLRRPFSVPLDSKISSNQSSVQHCTDMESMKWKAEIWRDKRGEGDLTDEHSPEVHRRRNKREEYL